MEALSGKNKDYSREAHNQLTIPPCSVQTIPIEIQVNKQDRSITIVTPDRFGNVALS